MRVSAEDRQISYRRLIATCVLFYFTAMPLLLVATGIYGDAALRYANETTVAMLHDAGGNSPLDRLFALPG